MTTSMVVFQSKNSSTHTNAYSSTKICWNQGNFNIWLNSSCTIYSKRSLKMKIKMNKATWLKGLKSCLKRDSSPKRIATNWCRLNILHKWTIGRVLKLTQVTVVTQWTRKCYGYLMLRIDPCGILLQIGNLIGMCPWTRKRKGSLKWRISN